jgi:hypothetical protein
MAKTSKSMAKSKRDILGLASRVTKNTLRKYIIRSLLGY